uniref:EGF-like domain-containing protein n=1 Tax=Onchocerca volvulus TaxID=6282 RepID=A0A8R1XV45_ONCVO
MHRKERCWRLHCLCLLRFTGRHCEENSNNCAQFNPCMNGGECIDIQGEGYYCKCRIGFRGINCEITEIRCVHNLCRNGATFVKSLQGFHCLCPSCFYGEMDIRHSKHFDVARSPLPIDVSEDSDSHYEETHDELSVPKVTLQQTNIKSSTINYWTNLNDQYAFEANFLGSSCKTLFLR